MQIGWNESCYHYGTGRYVIELDMGEYVAVMIYCAHCGALITQINKDRPEETDAKK